MSKVTASIRFHQQRSLLSRIRLHAFNRRLHAATAGSKGIYIPKNCHSNNQTSASMSSPYQHRSSLLSCPSVPPPTFFISSRCISTTNPCYWKDNNDNDGDNSATTSNSGPLGTSTLEEDSLDDEVSSSGTSDVSNTTTKRAGPRPTVHNTAPSFRATKVFFTGEFEHINVTSAELLRTSQIHSRDLFHLNLTSRQERSRRSIRSVTLGGTETTKVKPIRRALAAILPRKASIVVSFGQIRAVCERHCVLFLEAHDPAVQDFVKHLAGTYRTMTNQQRYNQLTNQSSASKSLSSLDDPTGFQGGGGNSRPQEAMELIFLEEVLRHSVESFNRRLRLYDPIVLSFLDTVANEVYSDTGVNQLVPLKDSLQSFEMHIRQCLDCLTELLDDDEEMLALLLTEQAKAKETGQPVDFQRHQHVELLLGVYARQLNNILMEIQFLLNRIQSKQEFVALALAGYRNRMIRMNVHVSIAALSLGFGTTIAGFYGMNVVNGFEESTMAFSTIVTGSTIAGIGIAAGSMSYLSGKTMQIRAAQHLADIEALSGALSDMCALDYAVKSTLEEGRGISKEKFRIKLKRERQSGEVTDREVDLLFSVFDAVKDGEIHKDDLDLIGITQPAPSEVHPPKQEVDPATLSSKPSVPR